MAADAVSAIMQDHRVLERLLEECRTNRGRRAVLLTEIQARLMAHSAAEEERVYPVLAAAGPTGSEDVHHGVAEHRVAEELLAEVAAVDPDSSEFDDALDRFIDAVRQHVEEEENELLPTLEDSVDREELERLGLAFDERRRQLLVDAGLDDLELVHALRD